MTRKLLWLAVLFPLALARAGAQAPRPAWAADVDKAFAAFDRRDSPGCALGVFQDGTIAYERGYGMADLEHDVPITPETVFYVGSVSKQFTAFAAALAIQQKKLSLDDPIRTHLPELPAYAGTITVRHLVHHTSGLRDYNTLLAIAGRRGDEAYDNATVLRMTARQKQLNFEPGDEYLYSNTGYTLLATIVERATGTPFARYADEMIFQPLGMTVTHFHTDSGRLVKRRAYAYTGRPDAIRLDTPSNERAGAGGVYTNVRDLLRWDENFYRGRVGGNDLVTQVQTPARLNDGSAITYAWGLQVGTYRGAPIVEHSGSLGGYRAHLIRFPEQHFSVAALCNLASSGPGTLARRVADAAIGSRLGPAAAPTRPPGGPGPTPARGASTITDAPEYAGEYYSEEIDAVFSVSAGDGGVLLRRESDERPVPLQAMADGRFRGPSMSIRFERGADRRVAALIVDAGRVRNIRFVKRGGAGTR